MALRLAFLHLALRSALPFLAGIAAWILGEPAWVIWAWLPGCVYLAALHAQVSFPGDLPRSLLLFSPFLLAMIDAAHGVSGLARGIEDFAALELAALLLALSWPLVIVRPTGGLGVGVGLAFGVLASGLAWHTVESPTPVAIATTAAALLLEAAWMARVLTGAAQRFRATGKTQDAPLARGDHSGLAEAVFGPPTAAIRPGNPEHSMGWILAWTGFGIASLFGRGIFEALQH